MKVNQTAEKWRKLSKKEYYIMQINIGEKNEKAIKAKDWKRKEKKEIGKKKQIQTRKEKSWCRKERMRTSFIYLHITSILFGLKRRTFWSHFDYLTFLYIFLSLHVICLLPENQTGCFAFSFFKELSKDYLTWELESESLMKEEDTGGEFFFLFCGKQSAS